MFNLLFGLILSIFGHSTYAQDADRIWFETAQKMERASTFKQMKEILDSSIPGFREQLVSDSQDRELLNLWGTSRNVDASVWNAGKRIRTVPAKIIQYFNSILKVDYDQEQIFGHAGLTHTYGYMMSNLSTPFGYKRQRYVLGEIESGFGLKDGLFSGNPPQGTLLSNLTHFAGAIAFRDQTNNKPKLKIDRLLEKVETSTHILVLRTDIVPFTHHNTRGTNTALLVYSVDFHAIGQRSQPKLITVFPVDAGFAASIFKNLGENQQIDLKYNAAIETEIPAKQMVGKRTLIRE